MVHSDIWKTRQALHVGKGSRPCRMCCKHKGMIRKYGLYTCRKCFRDHAADLGWVKYS